MFSSIFAPHLQRTVKPFACAAFGLFSSSALSTRPSSSSVKRYLVRQPSPLAPREVPTPLVFLSASDWDPTPNDWTDWSSMMSSKGFLCMEIDLRPPESMPESTEALMAHFVDQLNQQIRLSANPFPPVILSRSHTSLISQSFVSNHPCSALFLMTPPSATSPQPILPTPPKEFTFEPRFPVGVMVEGASGEEAFKVSRLGKDQEGWVDMMRIDGDLDGDASNRARNEFERWLDRTGF